MTEFILASKSPRRKELLRNLIESYLVVSPQIDESHRSGESAEEYVLRLALEKALSVDKGVDGDFCILSADTVVVDDDKILGKPENEKDAARILQDLRNRSHLVYSGIALYHSQLEKPLTRSVCSEVKMRNYSDREIQEYIASGDPLDKAGAYAIQHPAFDPAPEFNHCFANVMGLPLCHFSLLLKEAELTGFEDVADRCQLSIDYQCPVYDEILSAFEGHVE